MEIAEGGYGEGEGDGEDVAVLGEEEEDEEDGGVFCEEAGNQFAFSFGKVERGAITFGYCGGEK